jgi:hypothetical protein
MTFAIWIAHGNSGTGAVTYTAKGKVLLPSTMVLSGLSAG